MRDFKFATTLVTEFKEIGINDAIKYGTFYSNSKSEIIINESDLDVAFESVFSTVILNIQKTIGKGSGWIIDSAIDHNINISKYTSLAGCSYIKIAKRIRPHPKKIYLIFKILTIVKVFNGV